MIKMMMMMTFLTTDGAANLHPSPVRRAGEPCERESHLHCGRLQVCGREDKYIVENKNCKCGMMRIIIILSARFPMSANTAL